MPVVEQHAILPDLVTKVPKRCVSADHAIFVAFRQQQANAPSLLWCTYSGLVRRALLRTLGPDQELNDLIQDTFIRIAMALPKLKDPNSLSSFIYRVTVNTARDNIRKRKVRRIVTFWSKQENSIIASSTASEEQIALRHLYELLDRLNTTSRLVFVMHAIEQMEMKEVADIIGCSLASALTCECQTLL